MRLLIPEVWAWELMWQSAMAAVTLPALAILASCSVSNCFPRQYSMDMGQMFFE